MDHQNKSVAVRRGKTENRNGRRKVVDLIQGEVSAGLGGECTGNKGSWQRGGEGRKRGKDNSLSSLIPVWENLRQMLHEGLKVLLLK